MKDLCDIIESRTKLSERENDTDNESDNEDPATGNNPQ